MVWLFMLSFSIIATLSGILYFTFNNVDSTDIILLIVFIIFDIIFYKLYKKSKNNLNKRPENNVQIQEEYIPDKDLKVNFPQNTIIANRQNVNDELDTFDSHKAVGENSNYKYIPQDIKELLWIKGDVYSNYVDELNNEPSLIDIKLQIDPNITTSDFDEDIGYYPSYKNLSPKHKFVYLNWLKDITKPIPIGYVFIFYYGLERHLLYGNLDSAYKMIVTLRNFHHNNSFDKYSADALLIAALYHGRNDLIKQINLMQASQELAQFVIASLTGKIDVESLIQNCRKVGFTNKRYINSDFELFKENLENLLIEKFNVPYYPISENDFAKCTENFPLIMANYSLKLEERIISAPDINSNPEYINNVLELLNNAHELVKHQKRKGGKTNKKTNSNNIEFLPEELETLDYIKQLLGLTEEIVTYKKTTRYAYMHMNGYQSKWICRVSIRNDNRLLTLRKFNKFNFETEYFFDEPSQLEQIKDIIKSVYKECRL